MSDEKRQQLDSAADPIENLLLFEALNSLISKKNSEHLTPLRPLIDAIFARLLAVAPDRGRVVAALKAAHDALQANGIKDRPSQEKDSNLETTLRGKQLVVDRLLADRGTDEAHKEFASLLSPTFLWELSQALILRFSSSPPDFSRVVAALRSVHNFQVNGREDPARYESTHQEFGKLETMLRQQQIAVDRLLGYRETDGDQRKPVLHALQQTLFLQCPKRGKTAGRFRCVNRTSNAALVDIRQRQPQDTEDSLPDEAIIKFEPIGRRLGPEEAGIFCATVDLSGCQIVSAGRRETFADLYVSGELALKLFICVEIYDEQS